MPYGFHPNVHKAPADVLTDKQPGIYLLKYPESPQALTPVIIQNGQFVVLGPVTTYTLEQITEVNGWLEGPFK